ncbi:glycosyltransferase family 4 protein [Candidatus Saccharibacteria bacterium]|nr:MAG: glycosyltransferase family 4 protein [Candidatus Saccharibacteria bacterium]
MTVWIDLTDFLQWKGSLTGIQRIQYNLSKLYIESKEVVKFFVYTEEKKAFSQVDFIPDDIVKSGIIDTKKDHKVYTEHTKKFLARSRVFLAGNRTSYRHAHDTVRVTSPFKKDDKVLILGGIWVGEFINDLKKAKEQHGFKLVHFAFDMIPTLFPGFVVDWLPETFTDYQKKVFSISEGIIAISESTASDVREFIKDHSIQNSPAINVVRIGENIDEVSGSNLPAKLGDLKPGFILSVSTVEVRKNHLSLFYALREANRRGIVIPMIVIVGRKGWQTDDFSYIVEHDPIAKQGILVINDADDSTLVWLYCNCRFSIFPSFYEGWGMPVAESLSYGKLCISSNTSSLPEIAGDLIDYFSPYDTGDILSCIVKYLDDDTLLEKEKSIQDSYKPTSWYDMFDQVNAFVKSV